MKTVHLLEDTRKVKIVKILHLDILLGKFYIIKLIQQVNFLETTETSSFGPSSHSPSNWDQFNKKNNSTSKKCSEWIQSGCPLNSNMLINTCPTYKRKPSNNNYRQNQERKGRKVFLSYSQRMIGIINLIFSHEKTDFSQKLEIRRI